MKVNFIAFFCLCLGAYLQPCEAAHAGQVKMARRQIAGGQLVAVLMKVVNELKFFKIRMKTTYSPIEINAVV